MSDENDNLPKITDKQLNFVLGVQRGLSYAESYRQSYDTKGNDKTVWANASRLAHDSNVAPWLGLLKAERVSEAWYTKEQHLKAVAEDIELCRRNGSWSAMVKARELLAKSAGLLVDKSEVTHIRKSDTELLEALERELGPEARKQAERKMGLH